MEEAMRRFLSNLAIALTLVILALFMKFVLQMDDVTLTIWIWIFLALVLIGAITFNFFYVRKYNKINVELIGLLDAGDARTFVREIEGFLPKINNRYVKQMFLLNLSTGYSDLGQDDKAMQILEGLTKEKLYTSLRTVVYLNQCMIYFFLREQDKAMKIYREQEKVFSKLRGEITPLTLLKIYVLAYEGKKEEAEERLEEFKLSFTGPRADANLPKIRI